MSTDTKQAVEAVLATLGLSVSVKAGPNPHHEDGRQGVQFTLDVLKDGKPVFETDYTLGLGHVKLNRGVLSLTKSERRFLEAWQAKPSAKFRDAELQTRIACKLAKAQKLTPDAADVFYCLTADADAMDYATFEDWAACLGYDPDSRKAESVYRACLAIALQLRNAIGEAGLSALRDAYQDY